MVTQKQIERAMKQAIDTIRIARNAGIKFDKLAGEYFDIDDFSAIYSNHDELVDPLQYATSNLTWNQLCKTVEQYKLELKQKG